MHQQDILVVVEEETGILSTMAPYHLQLLLGVVEVMEYKQLTLLVHFLNQCMLKTILEEDAVDLLVEQVELSLLDIQPDT